MIWRPARVTLTARSTGSASRPTARTLFSSGAPRTRSSRSPCSAAWPRRSHPRCATWSCRTRTTFSRRPARSCSTRCARSRADWAARSSAMQLACGAARRPSQQLSRTMSLFATVSLNFSVPVGYKTDSVSRSLALAAYAGHLSHRVLLLSTSQFAVVSSAALSVAMGDNLKRSGPVQASRRSSAVTLPVCRSSAVVRALTGRLR
mmetsp:Transcript_5588/g.14355  ORF Transcript_5588/g.14355 Transcript_5588/m.14355 type:complete len:205 (-) Transcript_5588:79-693(-)